MQRKIRGLGITSKKVKARMNRKKTLILFLISPLLVLIFGAAGFLFFHGRSKAGPPAAAARNSTPSASIRTAPRDEEVLFEHKKIIPKGRTLGEILNRYGFSDLEIETLKTSVKPVYDLGKITAGHELRLYVDASLQVQRLEYDINEDDYLSVRRQAGAFAARNIPFPYDTRTALVAGTLEESLIGAFSDSGEGVVLAIDFAEIFAWDVDFYLDPRKGDSFRLIVQKKFLGDKFVSYGEIVAAEYVNAGKLYQAFRFTYPDTGQTDYYDLSGGSLRREFMKSPLKYSHITSRFSASRFHPIKKVYGSHFGVDYAAGVGTPVKATAPGRVVSAGWNGGAGRMVHIRHKNGYETIYMHLSGFAAGIAKDVEVAGGQVIGYVGTSGESTGPHLDYRITYHGSYLNPLGYRFKPAAPLRTEYLADFQKKARTLLMLFNLPLFLPRNVLGLI
jgi:murein DD-endopeptidase MepM/ murein hydrolase activator NlpD